MNRCNISAWGLRHPQLVLFFMLLLTAVGLASYTRLGQSEDPPYTFKVMVVRSNWPGASAREVERQVTDKIEKALQEIAELDVLRSYSRPGESLVFFGARDSIHSTRIPDVWYQVRKKIGDMRGTLPAGVIGPSFNDEFGDTYGNIFALVGEGLSDAQLKRHAEAVRQELRALPDVGKVEFFGEQEQRVWIEISNLRLATLGIDVRSVAAAIAEQNSRVAAGFFELADERIHLRPDGQFGAVVRVDAAAAGDDELAAIRQLPIRAGARVLKLGDIAEVRRGYADPPRERMRFMGVNAFGIGVALRAGGDIIALGSRLDEVTAKIQRQLPVGVRLERVADQPRAVARSVGEFVSSLAEAVVIVLAVSLLSLGVRTGIVVAISIPVVLAITFLSMQQFGIGLHKISLGALVLALGLLVDDAIIAVEMMATKIEQGWERTRAASFAYTSTAMPMLSGTLITAAGFLPIATAQSATGEYTRSIFQVTVIALLISWVAAVLFVPWLGYHLLPDHAAAKAGESRLRALLARLPGRRSPSPAAAGAADIYATPFYRRFRAVVESCVEHRWKVIAATLLLFAAALWCFRFVPQQFFPDSTRPELLVDLRLAQGASFAATEAAVQKLETVLAKEAGIDNFVAWVGTGSPRFYLPLDQHLAQPNFAQVVILTQGIAAREALRSRLIALFEHDFAELRASIYRLENGPPVGFPVQYRVSGPLGDDGAELHRIADRVAAVMRGNGHLANVQKDWDEPSKIVRVGVDTDKARLLGYSAQDLATLLNTSLNGLTVSQFREDDETIDVLVRGARSEARLSLLPDLMIPAGSGRSVPLAQLARLDYGFEPGIVWRRNRAPTVNVRANLYDGTQPAQVVAELAAAIAEIAAALPLGYRVEVGGAVEESAKGARSVSAGMPLFVVVVLVVLMLQLQSFARTAMVLLTAPLGLIGVSAALLLSGKPFGFVAMLGTIALSGMIMRNSVILIDQIDQDERAGQPLRTAIVDATVRRFRPIMLTAAASVLAMIPLVRSAFFGPMAVAIMGGLVVATLLTLIFLPALYAAWFKVRRQSPAAAAAAAGGQHAV